MHIELLVASDAEKFLVVVCSKLPVGGYKYKTGNPPNGLGPKHCYQRDKARPGKGCRESPYRRFVRRESQQR